MLLEFTLFILIGFSSSIVGAISTGAGLITIPGLIFAGLSPQTAIATSRLGGVITTASGLMKFYRSKKIVYRHLTFLIPLSIIASFSGTFFVVNFSDSDLLQRIIGVLLLIMLPVVLNSKRLAKNRSSKRENRVAAYSLFFLILCYASFFTGGAGALVLITFSYFLGMELVEANATTHAAWIFMQIISSIIFISAGLVDYLAFFGLAIGNIFGGYLGAHIAVKKGDRLVRVLLSIVITAAALRMLIL